MHQQLWGYKVEWKSVSRGTGRKKVEYHCSMALVNSKYLIIMTNKSLFHKIYWFTSRSWTGVHCAENWMRICQSTVNLEIT
jgi:hypothetical protein